MGACNACEKIDDTPLLALDEEGAGTEALQPPTIEPVSTDTRGEGGARPHAHAPAPADRQHPERPRRCRIRSACRPRSRCWQNPDLFKDITGLEGSQKAALAAFSGSLDVASALGGEAAKLATQQEAARTADRTLASITQAQQDGLLTADQAQALTEAALSRLVGQPSATEASQGNSAAAGEVLDGVVDAAVQSGQGEVTSSTPEQTVTVTFDGAPPTVGAASSIVGIDTPTPPPIKQSIITERIVASGPSRSFLVTDRKRTKAAVLALKRIDLGAGTVQHIGKTFFDHGLLVDDPADASKFLVPLRLRIAYPESPVSAGTIAGSDRVPVVVLVHGNHASWVPTTFGPPSGTVTHVDSSGTTHTLDVLDTATLMTDVPSFEGYAYLQEDLAKRGIVSVSVDTNFANRFGSRIETRADMVLAALDHMRALDKDAATRYFGRLDLSKVGLMGHSRGGDAVVRVVEKNLGRSTTTRFGIEAVCSLAPTDISGTATDTTRTQLSSADVGFFLGVWGTLDGDVSGVDGADNEFGNPFRHYERTGAQKSMIHLDRCEHNRFNTVWMGGSPAAPFSGDDPGLLASDVPLLRSFAEHQQLAIEYIGGMFAWHLLGDTTARGLLQGTVANSLAIPVSVQWSFGDRIRLLDTLDRAVPELPGATRTVFVGTRLELADIEVTEDTITPGGSPATDVKITEHVGARTGILEVDTSAATVDDRAMSLAVPAAQRNWSTDVDTLTFRLGALYAITSEAALNAGRQPEAAITLFDTAGKTATVVIAPGLTTPSPERPPFHQVDYEKASGGASILNATLFRSETVRVRLDRFGGAPGIDLANVAQMLVKFDNANGTRVLFDTFALVKE